MDLVVQTWPIGRCIDYARNPRKNDEQTDRMVAAIREFGFRIPIVAKSDGLVIDGHLRLKAARKLGLTHVPVALADELTESQVKAFRLLANRSASWASWDDELLKLELDDLKLDGFDLALTGFDDDELNSLLAGGVGDDPQAGSGGGSGNSGSGALAERFGVVPFSVLNAREGWWQDRKRAWLALGIRSEVGRGDNLLQFSESAQLGGMTRKNRKAAAGAEKG